MVSVLTCILALEENIPMANGIAYILWCGLLGSYNIVRLYIYSMQSTHSGDLRTCPLHPDHIIDSA